MFHICLNHSLPSRHNSMSTCAPVCLLQFRTCHPIGHLGTPAILSWGSLRIVVLDFSSGITLDSTRPENDNRALGKELIPSFILAVTCETLILHPLHLHAASLEFTVHLEYWVEVFM